ncbi:MAG: hypothetical protein P8Y61_07665 [Gammaproteobacteria bacterium]|jgi:hypothetical protein
MADLALYPAATRHDPLREVFPGVYLVRGSLQLNPVMRFNRNMVVVKRGDELTVINSVRLKPSAEKALAALGNVRHVLRLGYFHGRDDRYYVDRFGATFWAPRGSRSNPGPEPGRYLEDGGELPFDAAELLLFAATRNPEAMVLLHQDNGVLLTCDALQNYADRRFCSLFARIAMPLMGFPLKMLVGPLWLKAQTPRGSTIRPDFDRVLALEFKHLIPGHGSVRRDDAKEAACKAVAAAFAND